MVGTGGFLLAAHEYVADQAEDLTRMSVTISATGWCTGWNWSTAQPGSRQ